MTKPSLLGFLDSTGLVLLTGVLSLVEALFFGLLLPLGHSQVQLLIAARLRIGSVALGRSPAVPLFPLDFRKVSFALGSPTSFRFCKDMPGQSPNFLVRASLPKGPYLAPKRRIGGSGASARYHDSCLLSLLAVARDIVVPFFFGLWILSGLALFRLWTFRIPGRQSLLGKTPQVLLGAVPLSHQ